MPDSPEFQLVDSVFYSLPFRFPEIVLLLEFRIGKCAGSSQHSWICTFLVDYFL